MKIKKVIEINDESDTLLLLANNNIFYKCKNPFKGLNQLINEIKYQYYIKNNILYHKMGGNGVEKSNYNPIERMEDITDYLHLII